MPSDHRLNIDDIDPDINHYNDSINNFKEYSIDTFNTDKSIKSSSLNLFHNNARSLMRDGRIDEYNILFKAIDNPFNILVFTETWLTVDNEQLCNFEGYKPLHLLRPIDDQFDLKTKGGGVSMFIKENVEFIYRKDLSLTTPTVECLFIELLHENKKYLIGGIYRVPNTDVKEFCETINRLIEPHRNHEIVLLGDFNICLLQDNCCKRELQNTMQANSLYPTILTPTRVATVLRDGQLVTTKTLIDNIFLNTQNDFKSGTLEISISDHYPVFITLPDSKLSDTNEETIIYYRLINEITMRKFKYALENDTELNDIYNNNNVQTVFSDFLTNFNKLYEHYFPVKEQKLTRKGTYKPWINLSLISRMKIKDNLFKLSKRGLIDRKIYTDFRNSLNTQIRNAKSEYYTNKFNENEGNIKETWKTINNTIKTKKKSNATITLNENDKPIENKDIPNSFNNYFTGIANQLTNQLPTSQHSASSYLRDRINNTFFMSPIEKYEISKAVNKLKPNGKGSKTISTMVLKDNSNKLADILMHVLNICVAEGYFPEELKTGCITPIYKNGPKNDVKNYRPVCSLSPFSKILEKIIYNRMIEFIDQNEILSSNQFGFRKGLSTESAIIQFINNIHNGLHYKHNTVAVFMDLSKAFDVLDHDILFKKLEHYGFRGKILDLLKSFISNRKYFVSVNGSTSDTKTVNIGVPQGSTLGPLLFLIYVNDMCNSSSILNFTQFADDTTITHSGPDLELLTKEIEQELAKVLEWLLANKLIINLTKTHSMLFTNKKVDRKITIRANNTNLEQKTECKFLGVIVDDGITWKSHINHISSKITKTLAILRLLKYTFPKHILKTLFMSLIQPYLNYCNIIWGSADKTIIEPLFILQKKAIRIVNRVHYLEHTKPLFETMKILTVHQIHDLNCLAFIYKCLHSNQYLDFKNEMTRNSDYHTYNTRNNSDFRLPCRDLKSIRQSFFYKGINLWNRLNYNLTIYKVNLQFKSNLLSFKKRIKHKILTDAI